MKREKERIEKARELAFVRCLAIGPGARHNKWNRCNKDSDKDGLVDGKILELSRTDRRGTAPQGYEYDSSDNVNCEDCNLNGIVDEGETDPLNRDSDGNGIPDGQEQYINALTQL